VGHTSSSRGEVPGEREPVLRDDDVTTTISNNNEAVTIAV